MPDLSLATQDAFVEALNPLAGMIVAGRGAQVFQHVPERKPAVEPPFFVVGDITATPIGGKDGGVDEITVEVLTLYRGEARRFLLEMQDAVRLRIDGKALPAQAGVSLSRPVADGREDELLEDGLTYVGTQRFKVIAQDAD